jgi:hypothetical protein
MTGMHLKTARSLCNWTQSEGGQASRRYTSLPLDGRARLAFCFGPAIVGRRTEEVFKNALGGLEYPGFAYLKERDVLNPAELLVALDTEDLDSRVTEALPWFPLHFPELNWQWLMNEAKCRDRQNRLVFVIELGRKVAEANADAPLAEALRKRVAALERSRLAVEDMP